jgi:murein DD-endopeptidase MepM/ murein hydrolase activator NlpD
MASLGWYGTSGDNNAVLLICQEWVNIEQSMGKNFKLKIIVVLTVIVLAAVFAYVNFAGKIKEQKNSPNMPINNIQENSNTAAVTQGANDVITQNETSRIFSPPISDAQNRITKKPFGIKVSPSNSPVQPERFAGYHTGADFETTPAEANQEILVHAICAGKIIQAGWVSGYGNVIVVSCNLDKHPITVVYGHLSFAGSVAVKNGATVSAGQSIAALGAGYSHDTDGERKHLHLGIHKGAGVELRGYVSSSAELSAWINAQDYINFSEKVN